VAWQVAVPKPRRTKFVVRLRSPTQPLGHHLGSLGVRLTGQYPAGGTPPSEPASASIPPERMPGLEAQTG